MAVSTDEAVKAAQRLLQETRVEAVKALADARQEVADAQADKARRLEEVRRETDARLATAQRADKLAWKKAMKAGWTPAELKRIGFRPPSGTRTRKPTTKDSQAATDEFDAGPTSADPYTGPSHAIP
jgi:ribosomal protein L29